MSGKAGKAALMAGSAACAALALALAAVLVGGMAAGSGGASGADGAAGQAQAAAQSGEDARSAGESGGAAGGEPEADGAGDGAASAEGAHVHTWSVRETVRHEAAKEHVETVTEPGQDVVETHTVCDACGAYLDDEAALEAHYRSNPSHASAGYTRGVPVVTGQTPGTTRQVTVVDSPERDVVVKVKTCTVCGQVEEEVEG